MESALSAHMKLVGYFKSGVVFKGIFQMPIKENSVAASPNHEQMICPAKVLPYDEVSGNRGLSYGLLTAARGHLQP